MASLVVRKPLYMAASVGSNALGLRRSVGRGGGSGARGGARWKVKKADGCEIQLGVGRRLRGARELEGRSGDPTATAL